MRTVDRYRAWALRGPFRLDVGEGCIKIKWPTPDALLSYDSRDTTARRLIHLAGTAAEDVMSAVGDDDGSVLELILADLAEYFGCTRGRQLSSLLDRYGDSFAADLEHIFGIDVLDVFRGTRVPDEIMERQDKFPRHSRLSEALAQDDELASTFDCDDDGSPSVPDVRFTEWTPEAERITKTNDLLGEILSAIAAIAGSKINIPPEPRPIGASARLEAARDEDDYREVEADVEAAKVRHAALHPDEP